LFFNVGLLVGDGRLLLLELLVVLVLTELGRLRTRFGGVGGFLSGFLSRGSAASQDLMRDSCA
jgi:hypothetical protein